MDKPKLLLSWSRILGIARTNTVYVNKRLYMALCIQHVYHFKATARNLTSIDGLLQLIRYLIQYKMNYLTV